MPRIARTIGVLLVLGACTQDPEESVGSGRYAGMNMQGMNMPGMNMQGMNMQGMNMQGFRLGGVTLSGDTLENVRVEKGELVAERRKKATSNHTFTLRGTALVGAHLYAQAQSTLQTIAVEYRIADIEPESAAYDPTSSGATYLYQLEQWVADDGTWNAACPVDPDGRQAAIPLTATWDAQGDRVESSALFTFGCTTGVLAKCYRWGYRPWLEGYGDMVSMHWACTRAARADYCGNGVSHTQDGTWINIWDRLPPPGPIQTKADAPPDFIFEAGWNTGGAVCLSHLRWLAPDALAIAAQCPTRLIPLGLGETICDTTEQVLSIDPDAQLFDESQIHL